MDYETKEQSAAFLSFSLSHDASKHDMFACVIYASPEAKFIWLKSKALFKQHIPTLWHELNHPGDKHTFVCCTVFNLADWKHWNHNIPIFIPIFDSPFFKSFHQPLRFVSVMLFYSVNIQVKSSWTEAKICWTVRNHPLVGNNHLLTL